MLATALTDLNAISLTNTAKATASAKGVDIAALVALAQSHIIELTTLLKAIVAIHPTSGDDASNYAALNTIIGKMAAKPLPSEIELALPVSASATSGPILDKQSTGTAQTLSDPVTSPEASSVYSTSNEKQKK